MTVKFVAPFIKQVVGMGSKEEVIRMGGEGMKVNGLRH